MKDSRPIHPILVVFYPTLALYAANLEIIAFSHIISSLLACCVVAAASSVFLRASKNPQKRAIVLTTALLYIFSFTPGILACSRMLSSLRLTPYDTYWFFFFCYTALFLIIVLLIVRARRPLNTLTRFLNISSIALIITACVPIIIFQAATYMDWRCFSTAHQRQAQQRGTVSSTDPDIYYIIADGYGGERILRDIMGIDNSAFLSALRERGFQVVPEARSNYTQTYLSLASSLNMDIAGNLSVCQGRPLRDKSRLPWFIQNSLVGRTLRDRGYHSAYLAPCFFGLESSAGVDAAITGRDYFTYRFVLNEFVSILLDKTVFVLLKPYYAWESCLHRRLVLQTFETLKESTRLPSPKFVFCHILAPHPPFLFHADGTPAQPRYPVSLGDGTYFTGSLADYREGYREQLLFMNARLLESIDFILANSSRPAAIILQADHGPGSLLNWDDMTAEAMRERFSILNAYLLPGTDTKIPDDITPVNSFRLLFNAYFRTGLPLLGNRSFFSTWKEPLIFRDVN